MIVTSRSRLSIWSGRVGAWAVDVFIDQYIPWLGTVASIGGATYLYSLPKFQVLSYLGFTAGVVTAAVALLRTKKGLIESIKHRHRISEKLRLIEHVVNGMPKRVVISPSQAVGKRGKRRDDKRSLDHLLNLFDELSCGIALMLKSFGVDDVTVTIKLMSKGKLHTIGCSTAREKRMDGDASENPFYYLLVKSFESYDALRDASRLDKGVWLFPSKRERIPFLGVCDIPSNIFSDDFEVFEKAVDAIVCAGLTESGAIEYWRNRHKDLPKKFLNRVGARYSSCAGMVISGKVVTALYCPGFIGIDSTSPVEILKMDGSVLHSLASVCDALFPTFQQLKEKYDG